MTEFQMTIGGEPAQTTNTFDVINPATGKPFAQAPHCSGDQLDAAMAPATSAFGEWRKDEAKRRGLMKQCAATIRDNVGDLARLLVQEQGKTLENATGEVMGTAVWFEVTSGLEIPTEVVQDDDSGKIEVRRKALGVVAAITPWNYPLILAAWKLAPALLTGNTVVLKPSPFTPLTTLELGRILREVLPPGVLNVVSGQDPLGAHITAHPTPRKITFTGSVVTGKKVMAAASSDLKRVTLELGGNDAAIILDDVDPKAIVEKVFWGAFSNSGQICSAIKRLYVHEKVYPTFLDELKTVAEGVKVGNGLDEGVKLGPLNNEPQLDRVRELVADAKKAGAKVVTGGDTMGDEGYFHQLTLLTDLADDTRIVAEEQFGPALPVLPYKTVDEAIERANATDYGLSGSVWGADVDRATDLASQLECGSAWVNQHIAITPQAPFGGCKHSGIGYEHGHWGLEAFTELQVVNVSKK